MLKLLIGSQFHFFWTSDQLKVCCLNIIIQDYMIIFKLTTSYIIIIISMILYNLIAESALTWAINPFGLRTGQGTIPERSGSLQLRLQLCCAHELEIKTLTWLHHHVPCSRAASRSRPALMSRLNLPPFSRRPPSARQLKTGRNQDRNFSNWPSATVLT